MMYCDYHYIHVAYNVLDCILLPMPGVAFAAPFVSSFGPGSGLIFLDNVQCEGTEGSLLECPSQDPGNHNCGRSEDAGVFCPGGKWVGEWGERGMRGEEKERVRRKGEEEEVDRGGGG